MCMELSKVVYRRKIGQLGSASRLLQDATIDLAAATILHNCMKEIKLFEAELGF